MKWIRVKDQEPERGEPILYARPNKRRGKGQWSIGIAYWTVSEKWNPEFNCEHAPEGFTHWCPIPNSTPVLYGGSGT